MCSLQTEVFHELFQLFLLLPLYLLGTRFLLLLTLLLLVFLLLRLSNFLSSGRRWSLRLWVLDGLKQLVDCVFFLLKGLELALPFHLLLIAELNPREVVGKLHERILFDEGIARIWVTELVSVAAGIEGYRGPVHQHQLL